MTIIDLLKHRKMQVSAREFIAKVHQDVVRSCTNPEEVERYIAMLSLDKKTEEILMSTFRKENEHGA